MYSSTRPHGGCSVQRPRVRVYAPKVIAEVGKHVPYATGPREAMHPKMLPIDNAIGRSSWAKTGRLRDGTRYWEKV